MERAKEAFEKSKFGRTEGLSRALQNEIKEFRVMPKGVPDPGFKPQSKPQVPDPGFRPMPKVPDPGFKPLKEPQVPDPGFRPEPDEMKNIYDDPKLSPPKPNRAEEVENPDEFLMEIEQVKDSKGLFDKAHSDAESIRKILEKMPAEMEFRMQGWKSHESFDISQ
jgi:hypothetical protein